MPWSKDPEKQREAMRRHYALHREEKIAYEKQLRDRKRGSPPRVKMTEEEKRRRRQECKKRWMKANPDKVREQRKRRRQNNPEYFREKDRLRRAKHRKARKPAMTHEEKLKRSEFRRRQKGIKPAVRLTDSQREERKQKNRAYQSEWKKKHPDLHRAQNRRYFSRHPEKVLAWKLVERMLSRSRCYRNNHSAEYIGCSHGFLRNHIESLFKPGMSWSNYGEWHVDHIVPLSLFPLDLDPSLLFVASHWTNLQPLWAVDNIKKSNRFAA